jgi:Domain of unknown function (DUF6946)
MRFYWRSAGSPLLNHDEWVDCLDPKNRKPGTSAPTLAAAWSGPVDLLGTLAAHEELTGLRARDVTIEAQARFDAYAGNVRNHDLVLRGETADGAPVVVCVEAKAGEPLGATVAEQYETAKKALAANDRSNALARVQGLVERFCRFRPEDPRVGKLRYQLLTAWAGTLADAVEAAHAVFVVHEFRTDERPTDKSRVIAAELADFADAVLGCEIPTADALPWCVEVPRTAEATARLYLAHVVTDLRAEALSDKRTPDGVEGSGREVTGFGAAFWPEPETWGLRGDPHLWRALRRRFDGAPVPMREQDADVVLRYAIREIIGQELGTAEEAVRVPAFSVGSGMSDGHVSRDFWLERGLPLLIARAAELALV